jgi:twinkle protein
MSDGGHIRHFDPASREKMRKWYSGRVMIYDDNVDATATTLLLKMEEMARKFGTKVFLIDNLMMVDLECDSESRLQAEKKFIKDLINFAKRFNVLVFLVAHPRKTGEIMVTKEDISGSSDIVNLAHMVFGVHRYSDNERAGELNERGNYRRGKEPIKYESVVEVLKNRITGLVPKVELFFDYPSYRFYRTPEEIWHRYKWDWDNKTPIQKTDPNDHLIPGEENNPLNDESSGS